MLCGCRSDLAHVVSRHWLCELLVSQHQRALLDPVSRRAALGTDVVARRLRSLRANTGTGGSASLILGDHERTHANAERGKQQ